MTIKIRPAIILGILVLGGAIFAYIIISVLG